MRIVSLLPSATEIVFAIGLGDSLVGVTHECDYPPEALRLPRVTRSHIPPGVSSAEIDRAVSSTLDSVGTLYELDLAALNKLRPDLILTQRLCDVCAVSFDHVQEAVQSLPGHPVVLNLEPHSLAEILGNILTVGRAAGAESAAEDVVRNLQDRIEAVRRKGASANGRPRVVCLEWVEPPYCGGHWMPELVEIAGGQDDLAARHRPSHRIDWTQVVDFAPQVVVLTCCGFGLQRVLEEGATLAKYPAFSDLPAAQAGRVFATDGSAYFSRPGPRIVDSLEILAHLIHPELFAPPRLVPAAFAHAVSHASHASHFGKKNAISERPGRPDRPVGPPNPRSDIA
ncbi:MAG TPA: cobalamin-binding protein [Terriglobia bacterium]|nr:cobalamin-binding protein [Terriglobia bacterium]